MEKNDIVFKLEGSVLFSPTHRSLNGPDNKVANLTENNLRFLQLLLNGVTEKEQIINEVWKEQRGAVSESSYYGQLYMLRKAFVQVGLKESLIHTIPRKGVRYVGTFSQMTICNTVEQSISDNSTQIIVNNTSTKPIPLMTKSVPTLVSQPPVKPNFLQSYHWKKLISLLAFFSFCWLSFLSVLIVIILFNGDGPHS
ncbi:membrane protein [Yersinia massiliensis]|uniref:winged helix-turn-helix domain-containing protein n=1 Tax=Yersinia massiliensis TaxID=419257 RepID=UPI0005DE907E|nr:membrane protein [Yersinia massiliensis]CNI60151.1 membrane protein [Yersinia massiliensis]